MRTLAAGLGVAVVAVAAAVLWEQSDSPPDLRQRLEQFRQAHGLTKAPEMQVIIGSRAVELLTEDSDIDTGIALMTCGIVEARPTGGGQFLLTEECVSRNGSIERRTIPGMRVEDGSSYGWMIRPGDDV